MDTFIVIVVILMLMCTHAIAYNIGKLVRLKKYGKQLDLLKKEMDMIKRMKVR